MIPDDTIVTIEPRVITKTFNDYSWPPPQLSRITNNSIELSNDSLYPVLIHKNEHLCQIRAINCDDLPLTPSTPTPPVQNCKPCIDISEIELDAQLSSSDRDRFQKLHSIYEDVFDPVISKYNDASGKVRARVNIGNTKPPSRKLHAPRYKSSDQQVLQDKFDELERLGVFVRPEDVGVTIEHVSPSFLVKKPSGGHRLVTAFTAVGEFCKILPSNMPTVEDTLRAISPWKYIIKTDLRDSFYQIPLERSSMKWCGTQTPFRGLRCYTVSVQGMPGSSETLEEMMNTVIGHLIQQGRAAKIADDLYVGGQTITDLYDNWELLLEVLRANNLRLKASKTVIAPQETQILGWDWKHGTIKASKHKILPLTTCKPPSTTTEMRSFIGGYKVFNRVLKGCSGFLEELEASIAGKQKRDKILWTDKLHDSFKKAQSALESTSSVCLPVPTDQIVIAHDGSRRGIGSIRYVKRDGKTLQSGYFSAKLKEHQSRWLPCEIEALSIAASVEHNGPYLRESQNRTQVLTDSRPCVQAWNKMKRGQFSTSSRVATFMSTLSQYNVDLIHIKGESNLPADFASRNPPECNSASCQICKFVAESDDVVVKSVTVDKILSGHTPVPYVNRKVWKNLQHECPDLRKVHGHLSNGTAPSTKSGNSTNVKRYMKDVIISNDGLLVKYHYEPHYPRREQIVIPQHLVHGLLTSLHLQLNHPTAYQLLQVFHRSYFALKAQSFVNSVHSHCHTCQSLKTIPKELHTQSTVDTPDTPARSYAVDIIKRFLQKIFVIRDTFSSYTHASIELDESHETLRCALITSVSIMRPTPQTHVTIRVDNAPGFESLRNDKILREKNISLDFGRCKNKNKNPVVDKGIRELISEILRFCPNGGKVTPIELASVVNQLNSRIRNRGLSAWEIFHQRDQLSGEQLNISDAFLTAAQSENRQRNRSSSEKSKACGGPPATLAAVHPGSLVYIKNEGDKTHARERYIVISIDGEMCKVQKITKSIRNVQYNVKLSEIYPITVEDYVHPDYDIADEDDESVYVSHGGSLQSRQQDDPPRLQEQPYLIPQPAIATNDAPLNESSADQSSYDVAAEDPTTCDEPQDPAPPPQQEKRYPTRKRAKPKHLNDYEC